MSHAHYKICAKVNSTSSTSSKVNGIDFEVLSKQNMCANLIKKVFLFFCVLLQGCFSHFSREVDGSISDSYFYLKGTGEIVYFPGGNLTEAGYKILDADKATFRPIARDFGKDKDFIFYKAKKLPQVDYATFVVEGDVIKDIRQVYPVDGFDMEIVECAGSRSYRHARTGKVYSKNETRNELKHLSYD